MKRDPNAGRLPKAIWPIFAWLHCEVCCKEFRREWGWAIARDEPKYICRSCCHGRNGVLAVYAGAVADRIGRLYPPNGGSGTATPKPRCPPNIILRKGQGA